MYNFDLDEVLHSFSFGFQSNTCYYNNGDSGVRLWNILIVLPIYMSLFAVFCRQFACPYREDDNKRHTRTLTDI